MLLSRIIYEKNIYAASYAPLINNEKINPCKLMANDICLAFMIVHKELIMSLIFFFLHAKREKEKALVD